MLSVSRPMRGGRVERLRHADEGDVVAVEHLDQLREIHQRAAEPVDLVDDNDVDALCLDVGEQSLQRRPLQRRAGNPAIIIVVGDEQPALGLLACDVGLAGFALGIEGVELLLQSLFAGLARVDRAAELPDDRLLHSDPRRFFKPKNRSPFQRVPVMARAIADSDLYGRP